MADDGTSNDDRAINQTNVTESSGKLEFASPVESLFVLSLREIEKAIIGETPPDAIRFVE
jgi:hypothetical protein